MAGTEPRAPRCALGPGLQASHNSLPGLPWTEARRQTPFPFLLWPPRARGSEEHHDGKGTPTPPRRARCGGYRAGRAARSPEGPPLWAPPPPGAGGRGLCLAPARVPAGRRRVEAGPCGPAPGDPPLSPIPHRRTTRASLTALSRPLYEPSHPHTGPARPPLFAEPLAAPLTTAAAPRRAGCAAGPSGAAASPGRVFQRRRRVGGAGPPPGADGVAERGVPARREGPPRERLTRLATAWLRAGSPEMAKAPRPGERCARRAGRGRPEGSARRGEGRPEEGGRAAGRGRP